ncbi:MAG: type II toxin-antitoxin system VapC family toxin [Intrasporangium sp.]|uniref:type II toxin-antitoxin system VapC family toxin n=1 Tax=Intrasporangium sp. TaxID=1925024 RepID=UPI0026487E8B|nr:type II toxin-antitoxin system VapC family toxin [Intrasporangium sp.]MDN5795399.1 type II toxin-antitoxin system VapC family toxin [Intrasporangium sp.]
MTARARRVRGREPETCDTSVLIPAFLSWHEHHEVARETVGDLPVVPAHVLLETYSVLTRLPAPHRLAPAVVLDGLGGLTSHLLVLSADRYLGTLAELAVRGIKGGAVYDGLIAATAKEHGRRLVTLDRRALPTYEAVGVTVRLP